jgi:hypothetical protein
MRNRFHLTGLCLIVTALLTGIASAGAPGEGGGRPGAAAVQSDQPERNAAPLQVAVMAYTTRHLGEELVAAWIASSGIDASVTPLAGLPALKERIQAGHVDVVLGQCPDSTKEAMEAGLVIPESDTILFYGRLAMFLPPGDPLQIMSAQDLDRSGLRIGLCTDHVTGPLGEKLRAKGAAVGERMDPLLDRLQAGQLDVVVGLDRAGSLRPGLVTIHLPRSAAGEDAAKPAHGYAVHGTKRLADAEALLRFCAGSREADRLKLERAFLTDSGDSAVNYRNEAGPRMMPSYQSVAKQVAEDYAKGARTCLDLGCGPGQLTVEVAKATGLEITGLDIEPEAIEFAAQYAQEVGLASRMH